MKKYTIKLGADLRVNEYNHIWLLTELGFMMICFIENNGEELSATERWVCTIFERECKMLLLRAMENI